jgi:polysaccharide biosynthesis transport protein
MPLEHLQLTTALRARWRQLVLIWILVVGAALALSLALPPRYVATGTLMVEMGGADPIAGHGVFKPAGAISTYMATQTDVIRSEQVALGALRGLGLHEQAEWRQKWLERTGGRGDFEAWLAAELLRKLAVRPARDSNVVNLSFTSPQPEFSSAVVNAFVKSYMETTLQMQVGPARQFNRFFEERAKPLREALEQAKARLSAYEKEHGVLVNEERDVESERLVELTTQLVLLQDAATETANRRRQAAAAPGAVQEVRNDPHVMAISADLAREEGRLANLRTEFGEQHPAILQTRQSIADLRQRMDAAMQRAAASLEAPLRVNRARLAEVQAAIDRQRAVVLERKVRRDAAAALLRDVDNAQKAYDAVLYRVSQTALEGANTTQANISVLKSATPPSAASSLLAVNLSVAALLGLLLGITRAVFVERRDRRLRTMEDVTRGLQQPLLLALPDHQAPRRGAARRSAETQQRLVSGPRRLLALR